MIICSLFLGPKYDSEQQSYPGFEKDIFKTVSDYFYSLPQPLLTYELYELFINVLGRYCTQPKFIRLLFVSPNYEKVVKPNSDAKI